MDQFPDSDQIEWNRDADNFEVLRKSDIMISDYSGVIFDFAFDVTTKLSQSDLGC